jgi:hypothetical protein
MVAKLRAGVPAASLGLKSSGRVDDGEEFYFAAKIHLGDFLFADAMRLRDGEVSAPVLQPDGLHILSMQHNLPPVPAAFSDVEDRVLADLLKHKVEVLQAANERFLRRRADIQIASDLK